MTLLQRRPPEPLRLLQSRAEASRSPRLLVRVTTRSPATRAWASVQPLVRATTRSPAHRAWASVQRRPRATSRALPLPVQALRVRVDQARASARPASASVRVASSAPVALLEQAEPHVQASPVRAQRPAQPPASALRVRLVAVAAVVAVVPAVEPLVHSVAVAARARLASRSVRRGLNSSFAKLRRSVA